MNLQKLKREQELKEQKEMERNSPAKKKGTLMGGSGSGSTGSLLCARKSNKRKKLGSPFKKGFLIKRKSFLFLITVLSKICIIFLANNYETPAYEEMSLYYPQANQRRPLILVGPPSIGRHELRLRLLEDMNRFAAAVPR